MRPGGVGSINCTSCGAGLSVLGGGRVQVHVCGYCGAELDAQKDYRLLKKVAAAPRPDSPFRIGMTGDIRGVLFTVIGTLGMRERYEGRSWKWVDHQLYSPTHGYVWLSVENGHVTISRKLRAVPSPALMTPADIERAENRPVATIEGVRFQYYESGRHEIAFAEGEFNYRPRVGGSVEVVTLLGPTRMLHYVVGDGEVEYEIEEYLDPAATLTAFGAGEVPPLSGPPHPLSVPLEPPLRRFAMWAAFATAAVNGLLWLLLAGPGEPVARLPGLTPGQPGEIAFTVPEPPPLMTVEVTGNLENAWAGFEIAVESEDGEDLLEVEREIGFYRGVEQGESWTEDDSRARLAFRLDAPGTYVARAVVIEGGTEQYPGGGVAPLSSWRMTVYTGTPAGFWFFVAAGVSLAAGIMLFARRALASHRRLAGSDWTDED